MRIAPTNLRIEASVGSWEDQKSFQWKDFPTNADDIGASLDLAVQALDRIHRMQLGAVLGRECHVGQHVLFGIRPCPRTNGGQWLIP